MTMRVFVLSATLVAMTVSAGYIHAQERSDSTKVEVLEAAVVQGVTVPKDAPFAVTNVSRKSLQDFSKSGKEIPYLLSSTPGVLSWSENGLGTGTTYMRIRGAGDSRINVTIDGVPLNSPEDQSVFWANMNSYSHFLESIQIQRGVGTSTNGDGAFGGSVALRTKALSYDPSVVLDASYGSFNTYNSGFTMTTGLLDNHYSIDLAFHTTGTDGYVHGTSGNSGSWYAGMTWIGKDVIIRYRNIGNYEHTGQAWNGVTAGTDDLSLMDGTFGMHTGIRTYADMYKVGLGKYNSLYESLDTEDYQLTRHSMNDGSLWPRTTDNFWQDHNILSTSWNLQDGLKTSLSLHYTHGYGYYEEFRYHNKLWKYGLMPVRTQEGTDVNYSDFVRKKGLSQDAGGAVWNISYDKDAWSLIGGASMQLFGANHFGYLTYISEKKVTDHYSFLDGLNDTDLDHGEYKYYDSDATKNDYSTFVKISRKVGRHLTVFADLQYRRVDYKTDGVNDKFLYSEEQQRYVNQVIDIDKHYNFLNPKFGFNFGVEAHRVYASYALAHREPERNNFTDNGAYPAPEPEKVNDYEIGYTYQNSTFSGGVNFYYMDYVNQFVQTGALSDIGEKLTTNIKDSYRMGVELSAAWNATDWLLLQANATLSENRIKDFDEAVDNWDYDVEVIHYDNSTLAFSPSTILNGLATLRLAGFETTWRSSYVSRQYLDNTSNEARSLPAYSLSGVSIRYPIKLKRYLKGITLGADVNNVFNAHVATSGWVYSAIYSSGGHGNDNRYYQIGFIPSAGRTVMGSISLKF